MTLVQPGQTMFTAHLDSTLSASREYSLSDSVLLGLSSLNSSTHLAGIPEEEDRGEGCSSNVQSRGTIHRSFRRAMSEQHASELEPVASQEPRQVRRDQKLDFGNCSPNSQKQPVGDYWHLVDAFLPSMVGELKPGVDIANVGTKGSRHSHSMRVEELDGSLDKTWTRFYLDKDLPPLPSDPLSRQNTLERIREALLTPSPSLSSRRSSIPSRNSSAIASTPMPLLSILEDEPVSRDWIPVSQVTHGIASWGERNSSVRSSHPRVVSDPFPNSGQSTLRRRGAIRRVDFGPARYRRQSV